MSDARVTQFNYIIGNAPIGIDDESPTGENAWKQLKLAAKLILEEAQELYDAAHAEDIVEVLDGSEDVYYLRSYVDDLLIALNIDVKLAREKVANNNAQKYTTSWDYANKSLVENPDAAIINSCEYWGVIYYTVKNKDGKVQKLLDHERPSLLECIPLATLAKMGY